MGSYEKSMNSSSRTLLQDRVYGLLWQLTAIVVTAVYDFFSDIPDRIRVARKQHLEVLRQTASEGAATDISRTAIVAIYPSAESLPFTINLLTGLRHLRFHVIVLSTKRLSADVANRLLMHCNHLIERRPIGRDFGSYQLGLRLLKEWGMYDRIDTLVLANDSMFYHSGFSSIMTEVVGSLPAWAAIFENFEFHYHAQSFFQVFGRPALDSAAFDKFWSSYKPLSSRRHAIRKGEVGLTRALVRGGFRPATYYTSKRIFNALNRWIANSNDLSRLHHVLHAQWGPAYTEMLQEAHQSGNMSSPDGRARVEPLLDTAFIAQVLRGIGRSAERRNPTHLVGLLANFLCGAPIKRDVSYRGIVTIGEVLQFATGYSDAELAAMETDLRARGSPAMFRGIKRMLYYKGSL